MSDEMSEELKKTDGMEIEPEPSVESEMHRVINEFYARWHKMPTAILLPARKFFEWIGTIRFARGYSIDPDAATFRGVRVFAFSGLTIRVVIPWGVTFRFVYLEDIKRETLKLTPQSDAISLSTE